MSTPRQQRTIGTLLVGTLVVGGLLTGCALSPSEAQTTARVSPTAATSATEPSPAPSVPGTDGAPAPSPSSSPTPTTAAQTAKALGVKIEPGTYILWKKKQNLVVLVRDGQAVRAMPTTDLDSKTPVGTYHVRWKNPRATAVDGGVFYYLDQYVEYGPVPGHTDIAFHQDPVTPKGRWIQPLSSVGSHSGKYASHGCERLRPADAAAVWKFAKVGTEVRVR